MSYLVDTYALFEWLIEGNKNYMSYFKEIEAFGAYTTNLVLLEFYFGLYHNFGEKEAETNFAIITSYLDIVQLDEELIKSAAKFRSEMMRKRKNISYADSIGYIAAKRLKLKLLTGDKEFKGLDWVEFVQ